MRQKCKILATAGGFEIVTPYLRSFVEDLKAAVPAGDRAYNKDRSTWTVTAKHGQTVTALIARHFGENLSLPAVNVKPEIGVIELLYLGKSKNRGNGSRSAFGWTEEPGALIGGWNVVFPEAVLRGWFDPTYTERPTGTNKTLYETLGIKQGAEIAEVKAGYRRMVKQWHPDVCKDPDAHEIFIGIQRAYETLVDPRKKARYDVGLKLTAGMAQPEQAADADVEDYRAPLKCGNLLCEFTRLGVRKSVTKILQWSDIYGPDGKVLVSSWVMGDNFPTIEWR